MNITEYVEAKRELELSLAAHIQKEIKEFVKITGVPIIGGSIEMCTQQFIGSDKFISNVTVKLETEL